MQKLLKITLMGISVVVQVSMKAFQVIITLNYFNNYLGYRPILDAMKSFASESEYPVLIDIEVIL